MPMDRLVVVGASLAGLRAVEAARKAGFTGVVTLIGAEPHLPYDRPPLSKTFLEGKDGHATQADLTFRDEHTFAEDLDVDLMLGQPATALDTHRKFVQVGSGDRVTVVPYDALILATGTRARMIPGFDAFQGVHVLRTVDDACAIRDALRTGARTVVIGAGFIGSEIASSGRKLGAEVTILEALPVPLVRAIGEEMGAAIAHLHHFAGTPLHTGVAVERLVGDDAGHVRAVVLADGTQLPADLVVVGAGSIPNTEWLVGSGLQLHERDGGVICDATLFTGVDGVYAAGDIAWWPNPVFDGQLMRMENWTAAAEQGAIAARNAINSTEPKAYGTVPYFWSDWYDSRIQFVGTTTADDIVVLEDGLEDDEGDGRLLALYFTDELLVGALTVNRPTEIMKYRVMITKGATRTDALAFAEQRRLKSAASAS